MKEVKYLTFNTSMSVRDWWRDQINWLCVSKFKVDMEGIGQHLACCVSQGQNLNCTFLFSYCPLFRVWRQAGFFFYVFLFSLSHYCFNVKKNRFFSNIMWRIIILFLVFLTLDCFCYCYWYWHYHYYYCFCYFLLFSLYYYYHYCYCYCY